MRKHITLGLALALLASPAIAATAFKLTLLDSDHSRRAAHIDPNLVNAWGMAQSGSNPIWVSDNGTGLSTLYSQGTGNVGSLVVTIPGGAPTGIVFNSSGAFKIAEGSKSGSAAFIFDSEAGKISGWNSTVDSTNAVVAYDGSANGSVYKGLAIDNAAQLLFAADFVNNQVQVFDGSFNLTNSFTDKTLRGYAPFNVMVLNGDVYVAFAKQARTCCDEKHGAGLGAIDVFDETGKLLQQLVPQGGALNAPWGMAIAPSSFNEFSGALLVGNFGNGWINGYNLTTGAPLGTLNDKSGYPITIDGLWGLDPVPSGDVTYSAGPKKESHGALGLITVK
ncbi:MAG TPA: TIGR03118 family protein [Rhizomicrobium sp.]|jgi:uncharacterized protein (TIGR03118 family)|nr:TIGR03118 family protein [Rhizomicrobium sp.]